MSENAIYELPEVVIVPARRANIMSRRLGPGCYFRPTGFCIPDDVAAGLTITDIKIGKNSQFYTTGSIPDDRFPLLGALAGSLFPREATGS
jgi:hypothetical protein